MDHLVAFEYGGGRIWGYIKANSSAEIAALVPEVDVHALPPAWMSEDEVRSMHERVVSVSRGALDAILHQRFPAA